MNGIEGIDGLTEMLKNIDGLSQDLWIGGKRVIINEARILRNKMASLAPKDEGNLADAIVVKKYRDKKGLTGVVVGITHETNARHPEFGGLIKRPGGTRKTYYYPAAQEYGWTRGRVHYPGKPYIRPAWEERKGIIRSNIKNAWKRTIENVKPR